MSTTLTYIDGRKTVLVPKGKQLTVTVAASSTAQTARKAQSAGDADVSTKSLAASEVKTFGPYDADTFIEVNPLTGSLTYDVAEAKVDSQTDLTTILGAQSAQPASGSVTLNVRRMGDLFRLDFKLNAARITVTDAAGSGSSGSLKLFDFVEAAVIPIGSRQDYTAFAEGSALTGGAGDAAFVMALGSVAANAADGDLTGTEVDFAPKTGTITLSGGTGVGTVMGGATAAAINGTGTATDLYLNWSGTAATIDANSTIDVTGTVSILVALLGDD